MLTIVSVIGLIAMYHVVSTSIHNSILLPSISDISNSLYVILITNRFVESIVITLTRVVYAMLISFVISFVLAFIANQIPNARYLLEPINKVLKSIPNISFIIIALVWFGSAKTVIIIPFLIIVPLIYDSFILGYDAIDTTYKEMVMIYSNKKIINYFTIYIPLMRTNIYIAIKNALSLAMKVIVMAEVITQVQLGIGRRMYLAKINLEMDYVIAWTILIILFLFVFDTILDYLFKKGENKYVNRSKKIY